MELSRKRPSRQRLNLFSSLVLLAVFLALVGSVVPTNANPVRANTPPLCLRISEVYPAPVVGESEWVELWNCSDTDVIVFGFTLFDLLTTPSEIFKFSDQIIPAQSYMTFDLPSAKLNNTGDGVTLFNSTNQVIDQMSFDSTQTSNSWALIGGILGEYSLSMPSKGLPNPTPSPTPSPTCSPTPTPTPIPTLTPTVSPTALPIPSITPSATPIPSPTSSPTPSTYQIDQSKLKLTEIVACPSENELEWLELFWQGNERVEFSDWQIIDKQDNHVSIAGSLIPNGYSVVNWSKSILNNSGDKLKLINQNQTTILELDLPACQAGQSLALIGDTYQLVTTITKGSANPEPLTSPSPTLLSNEDKVLGVNSAGESIPNLEFSSADHEQPNYSAVDLASPIKDNSNTTDSDNIALTDNLNPQSETINLLPPIVSLGRGVLTVIIGSLSTIIGSLVVLNDQKHQAQLNN